MLAQPRLQHCSSAAKRNVLVFSYESVKISTQTAQTGSAFKLMSFVPFGSLLRQMPQHSSTNAFFLHASLDTPLRQHTFFSLHLFFLMNNNNENKSSKFSQHLEATLSTLPETFLAYATHWAAHTCIHEW